MTIDRAYIFDKDDFSLLESIASKGKILTEREEKTLDQYRTDGYVHFGITKENDEFKTTAKLTREGVRELRREKFFSNPVRRTIYNIICSLFGPPYKLNI